MSRTWKSKLCTESGKVANEYCPETKVNNYGATVPKEQLKLWTPVSGKIVLQEQKLKKFVISIRNQRKNQKSLKTKT